VTVFCVDRYRPVVCVFSFFLSFSLCLSVCVYRDRTSGGLCFVLINTDLLYVCFLSFFQFVFVCVCIIMTISGECTVQLDCVTYIHTYIHTYT
jgi:hypothetical protein